MLDLLKFLSRENSSKNVAKERLKLVLVHDRANCSPEFLERVKGDLLRAISQYMEIDEENLDIQILLIYLHILRDCSEQIAFDTLQEFRGTVGTVMYQNQFKTLFCNIFTGVFPT